MKLARNAVFAVNDSNGINVAFLYINSLGNISPFWRSGCCSWWSKHGELHGESKHESRHCHWYGVEGGTFNIQMIQSHVTKASGVDFKRALKYARRHK